MEHTVTGMIYLPGCSIDVLSVDRVGFGLGNRFLVPVWEWELTRRKLISAIHFSHQGSVRNSGGAILPSWRRAQ